MKPKFREPKNTSEDFSQIHTSKKSDSSYNPKLKVITPVKSRIQPMDDEEMTESNINIETAEVNSEPKDVQKEFYKPGEYIFFEGDLDAHFYIIESGQVQIFTKSESGKRIDISTISDGESFGEFAMLSKQARSASAQALTECHVVKVSEAGFEKLLNELPVWANCMMKSFAERLKNMNKLIKLYS